MTPDFHRPHSFQHVAVFGSSGAIGQALIKKLLQSHPDVHIHCFSRRSSQVSLMQASLSNVTCYQLAGYDEDDIAQAAKQTGDTHFDLIVIATGMLHDEHIRPEKSLREVSADKFHQLFTVNTIIPAMIAKHFLPRLHRKKPAVFAVLSARVGSITDNRLGGWYAYRASKAALNMVIKNAAIETGRTHQQAIVAGLHPGTVDSQLSKPFQDNVPPGQLFSPEQSAGHLLSVIDRLTPEDSGKCFAWDGKEIAP